MDNRSTQNRKLPQPRNNRSTPPSPRPKSSTAPRRDRRRGEQQQKGVAQQGLPVTNAAHKSLGARARIKNAFDYTVSEFKDKGFRMISPVKLIAVASMLLLAFYVLGSKIMPGFGESAFRRNSLWIVAALVFFGIVFYAITDDNNVFGSWFRSIRFGMSARKKKKDNKLSKSKGEGELGKKLK